MQVTFIIIIKHVNSKENREYYAFFRLTSLLMKFNES